MSRKLLLVSLVGVSLVVTALTLVRSAEGPPADHQERQPRPISLGTSGGNVNDRTKVYCCSGTLGCLVKRGKSLFILSNNHVLAITNKGKKGDDINQPGNIDVKCKIIEDDIVADLTKFVPIKFGGANNLVDAAIAKIRKGAVKTDGSILDVGIPSATPVDPKVGTKVMKSGRTTGHTFGKITAINVTANVAYPRECDPDAKVDVAKFIKQVVVEPGGFSAPGDSGALIVTNEDEQCREPVALLFAGSEVATLGNPIKEVLKAFKVRIVGKECKKGKAAVQTEDAAISTAMAVQSRYEAALMELPGVVGVGIGASDNDPSQVAIKVLLEAPADDFDLPETLEGIPVETKVTGRFVAF